MKNKKCKFKYKDYVGYDEIPCEFCAFKSSEGFEEFDDAFCFFIKEEECPIYKMSKRIEKLEKALDEIETYVVRNSQYWDETGLRYWNEDKDEAHDILDIINKAKRGN